MQIGMYIANMKSDKSAENNSYFKIVISLFLIMGLFLFFGLKLILNIISETDGRELILQV